CVVGADCCHNNISLIDKLCFLRYYAAHAISSLLLPAALAFTRTAENSGETAGPLAVFSFAKPSAAQDFRGGTRARPLIIWRKNSKISKNSKLSLRESRRGFIRRRGGGDGARAAANPSLPDAGPR